MDIASIQYFVEVAKELNVSKAAHNLHISQQTLSFHIQKLEEYYGTTLFLRKPKFALTFEGESYLKEAQAILSAVKSADDVMAGITKKHEGQLVVGISFFPAQVIFPHVLTEYIKKWPNIRLSFPQTNMLTRISRVLDCSMDISIGIYNGQDPHIHTEFLYDDSLYLVVSESLLAKYYSAEEILARMAGAHEGADLSDYDRLPWMMLSNTSNLGNTVENLFSYKKIRPNIVLETSSLDLMSSLLPLDLGAMICGKLRAAYLLKRHAQLHALPLKDHGKKTNHYFYALTNNGREQQEYLRDFIALTKKAFEQEESQIVFA